MGRATHTEDRGGPHPAIGSAHSCDSSEWSNEAQLSVGNTPSMPTDCYACQQAGPDAPFRERFVRHAGWRVAHDFNSSLAGWLVLVPLRHVHALDELTADEATTLGDLLRNASVALRSVTGCEKTYVMLFAEAEGFAHLHVHVVPRMSDQPADRRGPDVFGYLKDGHALHQSDATTSPEICSPLGLSTDPAVGAVCRLATGRESEAYR